MSAHAKANHEKFYIGIDANAKALEKPSTKATRKPAKGGLSNTIFVQAAVEALPEELNGIANQIHINFPWGSLFRAVATGDAEILASLRQIAAPECDLEIVIGVDLTRDWTELDRLGIAEVLSHRFSETLTLKYALAGFRLAELRELAPSVWSRMDTSWARKLGGSDSRRVFYFSFVRL